MMRSTSPPKSAWPGRVDDVDAVAVPFEGGVLGPNGDSLFALEIHRIHDAFLDLLIGAEGAGLPQQLIDQRGLAVIDVRNDGDVADLVHERIQSTEGRIFSRGLSRQLRDAEYGRDYARRQLLEAIARTEWAGTIAGPFLKLQLPRDSAIPPSQRQAGCNQQASVRSAKPLRPAGCS